MRRDDLIAGTLLSPTILRLIQSLDVQLDGDESHRRSRHGILHGVRIAQVLGDLLAIGVIQALQEQKASIDGCLSSFFYIS